MMHDDTLLDSTQRTYARLAGFMCLFNYAVNVFGFLAQSKIKGAGDFPERAQRVLASQHLYRAALASMTIGWVSIVILALALYVTLEPVDKRLAQLALSFRLGESFVGGVTVMFSFATLRLYSAASGVTQFQNDHFQMLASATGSATGSGFNIAMLFFSPGSILFFYLFYKSGYIPRGLAAFGVFGSIIMLAASLAALIFPEYTSKIEVAWAPMGVAEITTALWLLIVGVRPRHPPSAKVVSA